VGIPSNTSGWTQLCLIRQMKLRPTRAVEQAGEEARQGAAEANLEAILEATLVNSLEVAPGATQEVVPDEVVLEEVRGSLMPAETREVLAHRVEDAVVVVGAVDNPCSISNNSEVVDEEVQAEVKKSETEFISIRNKASAYIVAPSILKGFDLFFQSAPQRKGHLIGVDLLLLFFQIIIDSHGFHPLSNALNPNFSLSPLNISLCFGDSFFHAI